MPDPLVFISHKHSDSKVAQVVGAFAEVQSGGRTKVHLSSGPDFQGPRYGKGLNSQLRTALWNTDVLILIYTTADQDWSYCMWECGVATDSNSPDTNLIVFQCGSDVPALFNDVVRVNVRNYDDIKKFTDQFLRDPTFFPSLNGALAPNLKDAHIEKHARDFHRDIIAALPPPPDGMVEEWRTWPYLRVELPRAEVDRMEQAKEDQRGALSYEIVHSFGEVVESDARAAELFGRASLPKRLKFASLLNEWKDKQRVTEAAWFDSCCDQFMIGAGRGFPVIRWTPMRQVEGDAEFTPVVGRIKRFPYSGIVQFDITFYNLSDPRAVPVTSKMIPKGDFLFKDLGQVSPTALKLKDLVAELDVRKLNRVPLFSGEGHPLYIVHRSMIDKFIVKQVWAAGGGKSANELTLADLLADAEMKQMFENTFVVVKRQATLAEAKSAMLASPGCSDVFVTTEGGRNEPVQGWLTNVDIVRAG